MESDVIELSTNRLSLAKEVEKMLETKPIENIARLRDSIVAYVRSNGYEEFLKS